MKIFNVLKKVAIEFCTESSLHGMQYIVEPRRALIERTFWKLAIFVAFISTVVSLHKVYLLQNSEIKIKTSIASTSFPSYLLEQPAITICNSNKVFQSSADEFFRIMNFENEVEKDQLKESLPIFLKYFYTKFSKFSRGEMHMLMKWTDYLVNNDWSMHDFMYYMSQQCRDMLVNCKIGGGDIDCSDIFTVSRTGFGFCCSLDYVQKKDVRLILSHTSKAKKSNSSIQYGFEDGVRLLLNISSEGSIFTDFYRNSAIVFIHSPKEYPYQNSVGVYITGGTETFYRLKPVGLFASPTLRNWNPSVRKCYMNDEVKLKYFDQYTLNNCFLESDMETLIKKCNCLMTIHPNPGIYKDCTIFNEFCVDSLTYQFLENNVKFIHIDGERIPCFERCTYVRYMPEITFGDFSEQQLNTYKGWPDMKNFTGLTALHVFQQDSESRVFKRTVSNNHWEFIVVIGGAAGVVFGMNLLTIVEFIYFFTFRVFYYMRHQFN